MAGANQRALRSTRVPMPILLEGGATAYHLLVAREGSPLPLIDRDDWRWTAFTFVDDGFIADGNLDGWSWSVRALDGGLWGPWSTPRPFEVEPRDTDCPPAPSPLLDQRP